MANYTNPTQDFWKMATKDWDTAKFQSFLQFCWAKNYKPTPKLAKAFSNNND